MFDISNAPNYSTSLEFFGRDWSFQSLSFTILSMIWFPSLDPTSSQVIFNGFNHIMGVVWIPQDSYQKYLTQFVAALRVARLALLL